MYNSGFRTNKKTPDGVGTVASQAAFVQKSDPSPTILSWSIQGSDDRALDPAGGQTVVVNGAGFTSGMTVTVGVTAIGSVTIVNSTQATFTAPAKASGNYTLTMANSNGQAAILVPGLAYSTVVTWTTPAGSLGSTVETTAFVETVVATADSSITYALASGTLPTGATLNANGTITGTAVSTASPTTYSFAIIATDAELQDSTQSFTITVDPDSVTWVSPAAGASYALTGNQPMSNVTLNATAASGYSVSYAANALPTGVSLTGNVIYGTPTVAETVSTLLTATANTTARSSTETITWTVTLGDIYWPYVSLLLNGSTPTTTFINDASLNNNALTIAGDTKPNLFTPYESGYYSNYFDGTGDYLSAPNKTAYNLTGDFTMEAWVYPTSYPGSNNNVISMWTAGLSFIFKVVSGNRISFYGYPGTTIGVVATSTTVDLNKWSHVAATRVGSTVRLYVNGVQDANSVTMAGTLAGSSDTLNIGSLGTIELWNGYISNARIVNGTALYTASFTPPTAPLTAVAGTSLLTCQSNRLIDNSNVNALLTKNGDVTVSPSQPFATPTTISYNTQYSTYFDGTGDYLQTPATDQPTMTGNFTVSAWVYLTAYDATRSWIINNYGATSTAIWGMVISPTGALQLWYDSFSAPKILGSDGQVPLNTWTYVAFTRSGTTITAYVNGVAFGTTGTKATTFGSATVALSIGAYGAGGQAVAGCISNLRILDGVVDTAVPTSQFTNISGVKLLTCQNSTLIDNSTNNYTITSFGNVQPIALSPFAMTTSSTAVTSLGSAYFDGTGDYLTLAAGQLAQLGTQDFTIEAWINTTTIATGVCNVFDIWNGGETAFLLRRSGAALQFYVSGGSSIASSTLVANTWFHVAAVRTGTTVKLYINGVSVSTPLSNYTTSIANTVSMGIGGTTAGNSLWNGYIADARIVVGTALYTANFLPPQVPLTPVTNTSLLTCQYTGGATNNGFVDQSSFNNLITRNGNTTQGTFSPYSATGWSTYYNGSSDFMYSSGGNGIGGTSFGYGTGDFTWEMWIFPTSSSWTSGNFYFMDHGSNGGVLQYNANAFRYYNGSTVYDSATGLIPANTWTHIAVSRISGMTTMYVNGAVAKAATSDTANYGSSQQLWIARYGGGGQYFPGYISNLRIVKGVGVYTGAFTPSTTPLTASQPAGTNIAAITGQTSLLINQNSRFVNNSPIPLAFDGGTTLGIGGTPSSQAYSPFGSVTSIPSSYSNYFDGSDNLSVASNAAFGFGTGDFTVEFWAYSTSASRQDWVDILDGSNRVLVYYSGSAVTFFSTNTAAITGSAIVLNTWTHYAVSKISGATKLFVNGTQVGSTYNTNTNYGSASAVYIGKDGGGSTYITGYMSNIRVIKGTGLYSSNFTPSTTPLTTTSQGATASQVSLLTCQSATIVDNSTNAFAITTSGDTKPNVYNPFGVTNTSMVSYTPAANGGSTYFDGNGDYLTTTASPAYAFGTGDFTVEFWAYPTVNNRQDWVDLNNGSTRLLVYYNGSNIIYYVGSAAITGSAPIFNSWNHIAVSRASGSTKLFVNGVQSGSTYSDANNWAAYPLYIGKDGGGSTYVTGYMSDIRFTNAAIYKANFVPPVAPLTPSVTVNTTLYNSAFLLSGTSGGIIDYHGSNNLETVGNTQLAPQDPYSGNYYSVYFDGTGDYLTVPNSTNFAFGTGDFTVEFWMRTVDTAGGIVAQTSSGWAIAFTGGVFYWQSVYNVTNLWNYTVLPVINGKWHHVAFVRASGTTKLYYDGVQVASNADSTNYTVTSGVVNMGSHAVGDYQGYLSNLRVVKGTALYTTAFTPSTTPLTTTSQSATASQVSLLTLQSNKFIDNSTNNLAFTTAGTPGVRSSNPFQQNTGKSLYFDGTGDYVKSPSNPLYSIGTGDYTLEFWVYSSIAWASTICLYNNNSSGYFLQYTVGTGLQTGVAGSSATGTYAVTLTSGTWNYIAVSRASGNSRCFVNGIQVGTTLTDNTNYAQNGAYIGALYNGDQPLTGYIKDLRITKGVARYTTTFTPPTSPDQTK